MAKQKDNKPPETPPVESPQSPPVEPPPAAEESAEPKLYQVSLKNCDVGTRYFRAANEEEAWEKYKQLGGIIRSKNQPEIVPVADDGTIVPEAI